MNAKYHILHRLILKHKYQLIITYCLFSIEILSSLSRFYFFGEAINGLIKGNYNGLIMLTMVHLIFMIVGTLRHLYDTRTYTSIYNDLVANFLRKKLQKLELSKLSAHSNLAKELVEFLEHDMVYIIEALYNVIASMVILFFYDKTIVGICMLMLIPIIAVSYFYGKKMRRLNKLKNDELEKQVDVIASGNNRLIKKHYSNLRYWQLNISNKEAWNFGFMELMAIALIASSLLLSKNLHNSEMLAGSLFGIYSYLMKFTSGMETLPYILERLSTLKDIAHRIKFEEEKDEPEEFNTKIRFIYPETEIRKAQ